VTAHARLMADAALADTPLTHASSSMLIAVSGAGMTVAEISRRIPKTPQMGAFEFNRDAVTA
jgi:hypothetical protein